MKLVVHKIKGKHTDEDESESHSPIRRKIEEKYGFKCI